MKKFLFWGLLSMIFCPKCNSQVISLVEEDQLEQTDFFVVSESYSGLFNASKDAYLKASAYNFSQAWFRIRGYDSRHTEVTINGLEMNKMLNGRPQWSNWGGLNDIFRPTSFSSDLRANGYAFGGLLGSTNFEVRASSISPIYKISLASSNRSYRSRYMGTYASGISRKGIALVASASKRSGEQGFIKATSYNALSVLVAIEKILNDKNSLNLMMIAARNVRGKSSPNTPEVTMLKGTDYNSYWGDQNGKRRNSRIKSIFEPMITLSHFFETENVNLSTTVGFQTGYIKSSRLGYYKAKNPLPDYFQNLPSYFLRNSKYPDYENAFKATENLLVGGQLDWYALYEINSDSPQANYYLYDDRTDDTSIQVTSNLFATLNRSSKLNAGLTFNQLSSHAYAELTDLLGATQFFDYQDYTRDQAVHNDLNNPNRTVAVGDEFLYNYDIRASKWTGFGQLQRTGRKADFFLGFRIGSSAIQRAGRFKNGSYPDNSYGKSSTLKFFETSVKAGFTYKYTGRHLLEVKAGFFSKSPPIQQLFSNVRTSNGITPNLNNEQILTADFSYHHRAKNLTARITGFYTQFRNGMKSRFFFAQGLKGDQADFIRESVSAIARRHMGVEWSLNYQLNSSLKILAAGTHGTYTYTNNPGVNIESDDFSGEAGNFGPAHLKGFSVGGSHQKAYSLGLEYNGADYWWFQINSNYLKDNYLDPSALNRTSNFILDTDGIPYIDIQTGKQVYKDQIKELLVQHKLDDIMLLNVVGGKSWKMNNIYLGFFMGINNILGEVFRTGGFEQSRYVNYPLLKADQQRQKPLFEPKFWYGNPTNYFINLSVRY